MEKCFVVYTTVDCGHVWQIERVFIGIHAEKNANKYAEKMKIDSDQEWHVSEEVPFCME